MRELDGHLMSTINRIPLVIKSGKGSTLFTEDGRRFIDMCVDVGTVSLGYGNEWVAERMSQFLRDGQPHQLADMLPNKIRWECAGRLCHAARMDRVFLANSGTEANETAIKLARKYQHDKGNIRSTIYCPDGNFAGRTGWSLAATDARQAPYQKEGFGPMPGGFEFFTAVMDIDVSNAAAILLAPIHGNNAVRLRPPGYLQKLRDICDEYDILLIFDEVQTGMGRTGDYTASETFGVRPDVLTLGKGIALGWPMSACLASPKCSETLGPRTHYTTFGGGPFVCQANLLLLEWLDNGGLEHIRETGKAMLEFFQAQDWLVDAEGVGVHWGILPDFAKFGYDGYQLAERAREFGVLIATFRPQGQIKLTPALNITSEELREGLEGLARAHHSLL